MAVYGRDEADWNCLVETGRAFLIERARLQKITTYTELNAILERRTGLAGFDFRHAGERAAMGHLLGLIVERDFPTTGLMLSSLVQYLDANDAGSGFYKLAAQLGALEARASARAKEDFWIRQVNAVYAHYARAVD
ncbi:hypothetical protein [Amycolatopsis anabasis]|uniref:hypothetical protein n=1 Tax=Amycolatopsis anabasis TaxID=1840409 RepID=UPI0015D40A46|nr:hypothetical protein [Amycolatopsis anabasis]